MATQSLIIANTSPTVEVYRITDGANTYILAQDGYSANAPNTVSIQVDYSPYYARIAASLEYMMTSIDAIGAIMSTIDSRINQITISLNELSNEANTSSQYMSALADHYRVERAINISDLKNESFNSPGFDQFTAVSDEVKNPTTF